MSRKLVIFSGGMDSATLLWKLLSENNSIDAITFDYGQRHRQEIEYACKMIEYIRSKGITINHDIIDVRSVFSHINSSSLTNASIDVPDCGYTEESAKITVVPNRNQILLSIAVGIAAARKIDNVMYAAHSGDHSIYPDCRPDFLSSLNETTRISTLWHPVQIEAPFIHISKTDIVRIGLDLGVPYELTRSCYNKGVPCGTCPTCRERLEAFELNGVIDPAQP